MNLNAQMKLVISTFALVLLLSSNAVFASSSQTFSASLAGGVLNAGDQEYNVKGGQLYVAVLNGNPLDTSSSKLDYSIHATVSGLAVQGSFKFELKSNEGTSQALSIEGEGQITGVPTEPTSGFPLAYVISNSMVPLFFSALVTLDVQQETAGTGGQDEQTFNNVPMVIESPYLNPFGNPIIIGTPDSIGLPPDQLSLILAAYYKEGTIQWRDVAVGGTISGLLGGTPFDGTFSQVSQAKENLVAGTEADSGTITFSGITAIPNLNGNGEYKGTSTIPTAGSFDCNPVFPGTCTATGLTSTGHFKLHGSGIRLDGTYVTDWGIPALTFTSTVSGTAR